MSALDSATSTIRHYNLLLLWSEAATYIQRHAAGVLGGQVSNEANHAYIVAPIVSS